LSELGQNGLEGAWILLNSLSNEIELRERRKRLQLGWQSWWWSLSSSSVACWYSI